MNIRINELNDLKLFSYISVISKIISITLKMDLYKIIGQNKYIISELSELLDCHPERLKHILDLLVYIGLLNYEGEQYSNSPIANQYLCSNYTDGQKCNLWFYYLQEDKVFNYILKHEHSLCVQYKEEVNDFLERMDSISKYSAYWLWKKLKSTGTKYFLDVGCGSGVYTFVMCEYNKYLHADCVDVQSDIISFVNEKIKQKGLENRVSAKVCNVKCDDFTDGKKYDYILMSNILHYLPLEQVSKTLQIGYDALNEGGKLIIGDVFPIKDDIETLCYSFMWMQHEEIRLLEKDFVLDILSKNKFTKVEVFKIGRAPSTFIIGEK